MDVDAGWIFLLDPETAQFRLAADFNLPAAFAVASKRRMAGECRCITMLREGQLTEAVNVIQCLRLEQALPGQPELHQHASVPLIAQDQTVGILNLLQRPDDRSGQKSSTFSSPSAMKWRSRCSGPDFSSTVRDQEHTRGQLLQRLLVAQEEERRRIAQDLHDHAGQMMTALIIQLAQQASKAEDDGAPIAGALRKLHDLAQQGLDELRKLVYELRPSILDDLDLGPAIRWYADT